MRAKGEMAGGGGVSMQHGNSYQDGRHLHFVYICIFPIFDCRFVHVPIVKLLVLITVLYSLCGIQISHLGLIKDSSHLIFNTNLAGDYADFGYLTV